MSRAEKLQEIKEIENYAAASTMDCRDMLNRVKWLKNNLGGKQSMESKRMSREYRGNKNSKTLSFSI
tara:strand:- start:412 stop:612 length:201 start_codon:yes stop_codon:yes gene_type:complete